MTILFCIIRLLLTVLVVLIALVLILAALILFAPVRYRIAGSFHDEKPEGLAEAKWLHGVLGARLSYDINGELKAYISAFGFRIYDVLGDDEADEAVYKDRARNENEAQVASGQAADKAIAEAADSAERYPADSGKAAANEVQAGGQTSDAAGLSKAHDSDITETYIVTSAENRALDEDGTAEAAEQSEEENEVSAASELESGECTVDKTSKCITADTSSEDEKSTGPHIRVYQAHDPFRKLRSSILRIKNKVRSALHKPVAAAASLLRHFADRISAAVDSAELRLKEGLHRLAELIRTAKAAYDKRSGQLKELLALWQDERYADAKALLFDRIKKLLRELRPRSGGGRIRIGLDDPYSTGQLMQAAALLYAVIEDRIQVIPDFDKAVIDGEVDIAGRLRIIVPAEAALRIFFNKKLKAMYIKARRILELD